MKGSQELSKRGDMKGYIMRFEICGKESVSVARLIQAATAKAKTPQPVRGLGMKVP